MDIPTIDIEPVDSQLVILTLLYQSTNKLVYYPRLILGKSFN